MRSKRIFNLLLVVTLTASIVISLPVISFASTQAVNDAAANTKLTNIYNRLGNMYDRMAATNAYLANIQTYTQNSQGYEYDIRNTLINYFSPIAGDTVNGSNRTISQQIYDLRQATYGVGSQTADVSSKLVYTNNYLSSIDSKSKDYTQYIDNIESQLNDLDNLNWTHNTSFSRLYSDAGTTELTSYTAELHPELYFRFAALYQNSNIYKLNLPITSGSNGPRNAWISNIELNTSSGASIRSDIYKIFYDYHGTYVTVYLYLYQPITTWFFIHISTSSNTTYDSAGTSGAYALDLDTKDYVDFMNYLSNRALQSDLSKLREVYASDDVIAAKENQQAYEDQAITDFTGNGSAAASGSDTTNMKNVSGAIKSGLDSGGSVNGALSVFNTSGGLWDWFSQSNYDEINGPQTRSRGSEEYIDFYNINHEELERLLQEER